MKLFLLLLFLLHFCAGCSHVMQASGLKKYAEGLLYEREDNKKLAVESYKKTIQINGENSYLYVKLGNLYLKDNKTAEAKRCFFRALRFNPENHEALFSLGITYLLENNSKLAASYMEKGLSLDPGNHSVRMVLCDTLVALGRLEEASMQYELLLEEFSGNYLLHFNRGNLLERMGRYEQAEEAYLSAITLAGGFWKSTVALALLYNKQGKEEEALKYFQKAVELNPKDIVSRSFIIFSRYKAGDTSGAKTLLEDAFSKGVRNTELYNLFAVILIEEKDYSGAEKTLRESLDFEETSAARFYLGIVYDKTARAGSMEEEMKKAIEIDPGNALALNYLGYSYLLQDKNLREAYRMIKKACKIEPDNGAFLDSLGWAYYKKGNHRRAQKLLEEAASLEEDAEIYEHLGYLYMEIKEYPKSLSWFIKAYEISRAKKLLDEIEEAKKRIRDGIY